MAIVTMLAENTTLILNSHALTAFAEGDYIELIPANEATSRANSGNGGVTIAKRMDSDVYDLTFRVQKFSEDDTLLNAWQSSSTPTAINGSSKESFLRDGEEFTESFSLEAGSFTTQPTNTKNNQEPNALMEYTIQFRRAVRSL